VSPNSTRAFAARIAEDEVFRAHVAEDPRAALSEYALDLERKPKPEPPKPPAPPSINAQLFDPS